MPETLPEALTVLHKDIDTRHLDKFIQDLGQDLKTFKSDEDQAKLKKEAHDALVSAHIIPDLEITGVSNNHLQLEDGDHVKSLLDSKGKLRNEQGKILSDGPDLVDYSYNNKGELVKVKSGDSVFGKIKRKMEITTKIQTGQWLKLVSIVTVTTMRSMMTAIAVRSIRMALMKLVPINQTVQIRLTKKAVLIGKANDKKIKQISIKTSMITTST